jgi:hypothetical protein
MFFEGEHLCVIDFDSELPDLNVCRERLIALGIDGHSFSAEQTATGTTIVKIQAQHCLEWLRSIAAIDVAGASIH